MKLEKEIIMGNMDWKSFGKQYESITMNICIPKLSQKEMAQLSEIFEHYKAKLTLEVEEPILNEEERKYLSGVIKPFRNRIEYIKKCEFANKTEYIRFLMKGDEVSSSLPLFKKGTMYKGMELNKEYTLEDLDL